jgi:hypothetical protein
MSNVTVLDFSQVPAFAKNKSAIATALDNSIAGGVRRLSIKGGTFRYVVGGQEIGKIEERHIDLVLVNASKNVTRTWYAAQYDKDAKPTAPDCWSADGTKPDPKAKNKQSENCLSCPKNQKGSGQGESRACRYSQRLAVVLANDISGEVLQLSLPATSLFGESGSAGATLQGYYKGLSARSIDPAALVTRAKFDTDVESPKLGFTAVRWLSEEEYSRAVEQGKSEAAKRAVEMTVHEADGVDSSAGVELPSGTPPATMQAPANTPAATPVAAKKPAAPAPAEKPSEPVVRKSSDAQASSPDLKALVSQWADDEDAPAT